jgi:hypothetical protein
MVYGLLWIPKVNKIFYAGKTLKSEGFSEIGSNPNSPKQAAPKRIVFGAAEGARS